MFLLHKFLSVTETPLCYEKSFLLQKLLSVTKTSFCRRNSFLSQKLCLLKKKSLCHRNFFLSQTLLWQKQVYFTGYFPWTIIKYSWIIMKSFREKYLISDNRDNNFVEPCVPHRGEEWSMEAHCSPGGTKKACVELH